MANKTLCTVHRSEEQAADRIEPIPAIELCDVNETKHKKIEEQETNPGHAKENSATDDIPYSTFTLWEKRCIVLAASVGSFMSPLTTNIYYPALNTISKELGVSISAINLSITTYMIFQGIAPTFIGQFSDSAGRRPAYMVGFVIYLVANIGLALQDNYAALMVLRCIQSAGSSGFVSLSNGVVADMVTSAERGSYIGFMSVGSVFGPSLSPIIGGLLAQYLGWHSIFWFLAIFGGVCFMLMLLFFPETCRVIVGNGSVPPPVWNKSLWNLYQERKFVQAGQSPNYELREAVTGPRRLRFPNPFGTLRILAEKEMALIVFLASCLYSAYYGISATMTTQFRAAYNLNDLQLGLIFIPISVGTLLTAVTNVRFDPVDRNFRKHARRLGLPVVYNRRMDLTDFPIERARLEIAMPFLYAGCAFMIIYGWVLWARVNLAVPLVLLLFIGFFISGFFKVITILIVDVFPGKAASASAAFSLSRCLLGAAATAVINPMIDAMGVGWAMTLLSLICLGVSPTMLLIVRRGPRWRKERAQKLAEKQAAKDRTTTQA